MKEEVKLDITAQPRPDITVDINIGGGGGSGGGTYFKPDETLTLENGVLSVNTAKVVEKDNTLPVTSAAVFTEVGNINALLESI